MNNDTKVLALKYRPQNFDDLIGQDVVAETITNSIVANKVPNAYLFTGIRGVGKTTIARIVAKSLNCPCLLYTSPSPRDRQKSRMPSSA